MPEVAITKNLAPSEIVHAALTRGQASFSLPYRDTRLLLIRLPSDSTELAEGLASTATRQGAPVAAGRAVPMINFHTEIHSNPGSGQRGSIGLRPGFDAFALETLLVEAAYFIVPLRKRPEADAQSAERVSVGRARNKDIVLRHPSISKFHGWFQTDEDGNWCVSDAGSKNRTRVNDSPVEPKALVRLESGDRVRFGSVDTIVSRAETLWEAMHLHASSSRSTKFGSP